MIPFAVLPALFVLATYAPHATASPVVAFSPAQATVDDPVTPPGASSERACPAVKAFAERAMRARQAGVPIDRVLARVQESGRAAALQRIGASVVRAAYDEPIAESEEAQAQAVADFADRQEARCQDRLSSM